MKTSARIAIVVVVIATIVAWACVPVLSIQKQPKPKPGKECQDCHSDPHSPVDPMANKAKPDTVR